MPQEEVNKGPTGGSYSNTFNHLNTGGETHPTEAKDKTGEFIAYLPIEDKELGSSAPASEKDMRGGN